MKINWVNLKRRSTPVFGRLFSYVFAFVFFIAGITVGLGHTQIQLDRQVAYDAQGNTQAAKVSFWAGAYDLCMAYAQNLMYIQHDEAIIECNHAIRGAVVRGGIDTDPHYNEGYENPFLPVPPPAPTPTPVPPPATPAPAAMVTS